MCPVLLSLQKGKEEEEEEGEFGVLINLSFLKFPVDKA